MILPTHALHAPPPTRSPKALSDSPVQDFVTVLAETSFGTGVSATQDPPIGDILESLFQVEPALPGAAFAMPSPGTAMPALGQPFADLGSAKLGHDAGPGPDTPMSKAPMSVGIPAHTADTPTDPRLVSAKVPSDINTAAMAFADGSAEPSAAPGHQQITHIPDTIEAVGRSTVSADLAFDHQVEAAPPLTKNVSNKAENTPFGLGDSPAISSEPRSAPVVPQSAKMGAVALDPLATPTATPVSITAPLLAEQAAAFPLGSGDLRPSQDKVSYSDSSSVSPRTDRGPGPVPAPTSTEAGLPNAPPSSRHTKLPDFPATQDPAPVSRKRDAPGPTSSNTNALPTAKAQIKAPMGDLDPPKPPQSLPAQAGGLIGPPSPIDPRTVTVAAQGGPSRLVPVAQPSTPVKTSPLAGPQYRPPAPEVTSSKNPRPGHPFVPSDVAPKAALHSSAVSPTFAPISHLSQTQPVPLVPALVNMGQQPPVSDRGPEMPGSVVSQDIARPEHASVPHPPAVERMPHIAPEITFSLSQAPDAAPAALGPTSAASTQPTSSLAAQSEQRPVALPALPAALMQLIQSNPDGPITLILSPEDLGTLRFQVTQTDHGMSIHLVVDRPETLDLVRRQGEQLLSDLRQAGFSDASLSYADQGSQNMPQRQNADQSLSDLQDAPLRQDVPTNLARLMNPSGALDLRL